MTNKTGIRYKVSVVSPCANARSTKGPLPMRKAFPSGDGRGGYMRRLLSLPRLAAIIVGIFLAVTPVLAQTVTGVPPFSSFTPSSFDSINNANLNTTFSIPIVNKAGQGIPFNFALTYNSAIWAPVSSTWTLPTASIFGWSNNSLANTGNVTYQTSVGSCFEGNWYFWQVWSNFVYTDAVGTPHPFNITISAWPLTYYPCGSGAPPASGSGVATDGSGFTLSVQGTTSSYNAVNLTSLVSRSGLTIGAGIGSTAGTNTVKDLYGNTISASGGTYTDTLGTTALTETGSGTPSSPNIYTYTGGDGNGHAYQVNYTAYTVKTNFGCSGISEYGPTSANLVSSISLPDGTSYLFTYAFGNFFWPISAV